MTPEGKFKKQLKQHINELFPEAIIMQTDPEQIQGIPDLLVLMNDKWAALEVKKSKKASRRPNQEYYVNLMNKMSYAAFVYPENEDGILDELQQTFGS